MLRDDKNENWLGMEIKDQTYVIKKKHICVKSLRKLPKDYGITPILWCKIDFKQLPLMDKL